MNLGEDFGREQEERQKWLTVQRDKCGDYTGEPCANPQCGRERVMLGKDGKRRCEKCAWCLEDNGYDFDFVTFIHGL